MTSITVEVDSKKLVELGMYEDRWNALEQMRRDLDTLKAAIDRAEAFFSQLMQDANANGLKIHGVQKVNYQKNATFAAKQFAEENPDLAKKYQTVKTVLDVERLREDLPQIVAQYRGYSFKYVTPKKTR